MVAYSVATKNRSVKKSEKVQKKLGSSFCVSLSLAVNFLTLTLAFLGFMYVAQTNRLATMGYEIKEKENKISILFKDNEALKIHAAELKSMHQLELKKEEMNLKKPGEVGYLETDESVAMGK